MLPHSWFRSLILQHSMKCCVPVSEMFLHAQSPPGSAILTLFSIQLSWYQSQPGRKFRAVRLMWEAQSVEDRGVPATPVQFGFWQ